MSSNVDRKVILNDALRAAQQFMPASAATKRDGYHVFESSLAGWPLELRILVSFARRDYTLLTTVFVPHPDVGVRLDVRPFDAHSMGDWLLVRVLLGAPEFDLAFRVEGAPTSVVRGLIDPPTQSALVQLRALGVSFSDSEQVGLTVDRRGLSLSVSNVVLDPRWLALMTNTLLAVASRLNAAVDAAKRAPGGAEQCDAELIELESRRRRKRFAIALMVSIVLMFVVALIAGLAWLISVVRGS